MLDEDILKTVANELKMYGDFDNIDYLIPQLGQAIENILAKNEELKECLEATSKYLDNIAYDQITYEIKNLMIRKSTIKDIIEENKSYLAYANTAYEYTQREVIEENIKILQKLIGDD